MMKSNYVMTMTASFIFNPPSDECEACERHEMVNEMWVAGVLGVMVRMWTKFHDVNGLDRVYTR